MKQQNFKQRKYKGWTRLRRSQHETETTKQYTEQEIQSLSRNQSNGAGIIRPNTGDLRMPLDFAEHGYGQQTGRPSRVMLVIITLALVFIAIITYLVSQMPKKD